MLSTRQRANANAYTSIKRLTSLNCQTVRTSIRATLREQPGARHSECNYRRITRDRARTMYAGTVYIVLIGRNEATSERERGREKGEEEEREPGTR